MSGKASKKQRAKAKKRAEDLWDRELRLPYLQDFIESWNWWRSYYIKLDYHCRWEPKSKAQLTMVENIIDHCKKYEFDLDTYIACAFKAHVWCNRSPLLNVVLANGADFFERYVDDVNADRDRDEQERRAEVW